jgi:diacylglycerol kinase (ATP)
MSADPERLSRPNRTWRSKFQNAFRGVRFGLSEQTSFLAHAVVACLVVVAGWFFRVDAGEWALLAGCIGLVFVAELFNTSLEWFARAVTDKHDERIGKALDVASAAVLLASLVSVVVGAIIFVPRIWKYF